MAEEGYDPETVWETCGSPIWFADMPATELGNNITISGTINNADGSPIANTNVTIKLPLIDRKEIDKTVKTNSNGEFSFRTDIYRDVFPDYDSFSSVHGYITGYSYATKRVMANIFYTPSVLEIKSNGHLYRQAVSVEVGIVFQRVLLGNKWYYGTPSDSSYVDWYEL